MLTLNLTLLAHTRIDACMHACAYASMTARTAQTNLGATAKTAQADKPWSNKEARREREASPCRAALNSASCASGTLLTYMQAHTKRGGESMRRLPR